jgi:hypothetical protein
VDAGTLYGATAVGNSGELYILDSSNGSVIKDIGPLHDAEGRLYPMTGLAFDPITHVLYGSTADATTANLDTASRLVTINPNTAEVIVIGEFNIGNSGIPATMTDLAFAREGYLLGINSNGPPDVYFIDVNTGGTSETLGNTVLRFPSTEGGGIALRGDTYLAPTANEFGVVRLVQHCALGYCWQVPTYISISNPDKPAGGGNYGALDFDGDVLYGLNVGPGSPSHTHLVTIGGGGAVTDLGPSVDWLEAIAFIPEPSTGLLMVVGLTALAGCRVIRRRQN